MAKTAKKSTAKTAKRKTTGVKASAVSASESAKQSEKSITLERLYQFNLFSGLANLAFAIISVVFIGKQTANITLAYVTKDELSSSALGPAYKSLGNFELRYLLAFIFVLSAIFSLLLATKLRKTYEAGVKNSTPGLRWIFTGISLGLVWEFVTLVGGIGDMMTLKLVGGLIFTTAILIWLSERQNKGDKKHYASYGLSVFTGLIALLPLAGSLLFTAIYGIANFNWYVYTISLLVLIGFVKISMNHYKHAKRGISVKGYLQLEGKYISLDFLIKTVVFLAVLIALHK